MVGHWSRLIAARLDQADPVLYDFALCHYGVMETQVTEIAPDIYRLSTYVRDANLLYNQFLIDAEEPLLFHTGLQSLFPVVSAAARRVSPLERLRWITFGHVEADECGAMNTWLAASPRAQIAHGALGCLVSVNDLAHRPPRPLKDGEILDLGGKRVRRIETPHVPHGWDAGLFFEETTATMLCGDLFTMMGEAPALTEQEIVGPALAAEDSGHATCLTPATGPTIRALAELRPRTLGLMHGPSYTGDCAQALRDLAAGYDQRLDAELARLRGG
jgi:flavorubredoxin